MRYEVAEGDLPDVIADRFGVEVMRLIDIDGWCVQPVPFSDAVWPIASGDVLRITTEDLLEVVTSRIAYPPHSQGDSSDRGSPPRDAEFGALEPRQAGLPGEFGLPAAHPRFRCWFVHDLYDDRADEFAPFGSDEGAEVLARVQDLTHPDRPVPLLTLLPHVTDLDAELVVQEDGLDATREIDPVVIGLAFALLHATGTLDEQGRDLLLLAVRRQVLRYGEAPTLRTMLRDVEAFHRDTSSESS